ncbi:MAG: tetratricopeptide repeat protein [Pyrinomonadaceae bacterium]
MRADWALPQALLGALLARGHRSPEAEVLLRRALELEATNRVALTTLAEMHLRAARAREASDLLKRVTELTDARASDWVARAVAERADGALAAAANSLGRALELDAESVEARLERAGLRVEAKDFRGAVEDVEIARRAAPNASEVTLAAAKIYARANLPEKSLAALNALEPAAQQSAEAKALRSALSGDENITPEEIAALEKQLAAGPRDTVLLARLGGIYRTLDPQRSLDYYRRALELSPREINYATGYAAALVQARRFADAALVLKRIIAERPDDYTAHANLATALYELKSFEEAIVEFKWVAAARPSVAATHFFIATAYDRLTKFEEALGAYQMFLARADPGQNKLEIEKVNLRLPSLRNQIKRGEGLKQKQG